jgi:hypothetical protein
MLEGVRLDIGATCFLLRIAAHNRDSYRPNQRAAGLELAERHVPIDALARRWNSPERGMLKPEITVAAEHQRR